MSLHYEGPSPLGADQAYVNPAQILVVNRDPRCEEALRGALQTLNIKSVYLDDVTQLSGMLHADGFDVIIIHFNIVKQHDTDLITRIRMAAPDTKLMLFVTSEDQYNRDVFRPHDIAGIIQEPSSTQVIQYAIRNTLHLKNLELSNATLREDVLRKNHEIIELSTTVSQLERNVERTKREIEQRIFTQIRSLMLPLFEDMLRHNHDEVYDFRLEALRKYMNDLASGLATHLESNTPLSAQELRVALMVRNGMTSEEIAVHLRVSPETVKTHRRNIRRKFGLTSTNQKLSAYLKALRPLEECPA